MQFKNDVPIYLQIEYLIEQYIVAGTYAMGEKLPSVRELSMNLTVNLNTVQKALNDLHQQKIVTTKTGLGNFVTDDAHTIETLRKSLIDKSLTQVYTDLQRMGLNTQQMKSSFNLYLEGKDADGDTNS